MKTDLQPFYTIVDLMLLFGVSESTIRRWLADARKGIGSFPKNLDFRDGRKHKLLWDRETIRRFIEVQNT